MANTAAAFLGKKAYPYLPAPPPKNVEFEKYTLEKAANLNLDEHCGNVLSVYDSYVKQRKFPSVIFGAPNGAIVNLAVSMGVPYLCSQFRLPIVIESEDKTKDRDDLKPYEKIVQFIGDHWTAKYQWASVSCLVDPIHDRMDMGEYAHVRAKFMDIPSAFKKFLLDHVKTDGTIIFVNTRYPWISHRLSERVYLQIGGLGDVSAAEYLAGSERVSEFLKAVRSEHQDGWPLSDYTKVHRPESEWGTEPELRKAVEEFCNNNGYEFLLLEQDHPAGYNLLASEALYKRHTADGGHCRGYSINIFWGLCPTLTLRARLLGCWFTFTDRASLRTSEQQLKVLLNRFPDVPKWAVMGYYWSYSDAELLDVVTPKGWLGMLSKYFPKQSLITPGLLDLESTEHDIFEYEDMLYEESKRFEGKESKHNVTIEELRTMVK
jgi:hypothetical protein